MWRIIRENGPIFAPTKKCNFDQNKKKIGRFVQIGKGGSQVRVQIVKDLSIFVQVLHKMRHHHILYMKSSCTNTFCFSPQRLQESKNSFYFSHGYEHIVQGAESYFLTCGTTDRDIPSI